MARRKFENNPVNLVALWERLELQLDQGDRATNFITRIEDIDDAKKAAFDPYEAARNFYVQSRQNRIRK